MGGLNDGRGADQEQRQKLEKLRCSLKKLGSVAVAYSSGVDSTFLLKVAHDVLGDGAVAVTVKSCFYPARELDEAKEFCAGEGIRHLICEVDEMGIPGIAQNPKNRCYLCKREIFQQMRSLAAENGFAHVAEGSNVDDLGDYRPGLAAIAELEIKSPLRDCGLTKNDIRCLSRELGLSTWTKPSFACLASRFVYGETITREKLAMIDHAEQLLMEKGFHQFRVRIHGKSARIEVLPGEFALLVRDDIRTEIVEKFTEYGFQYVSMDLKGYRTGSMNEVL